MNNLFVYCEIEEGIVADVSLELLTKGRSLANELNCQLEAVVAGTGLKEIEKQILPYGVDKLHVFDAEGLYPYTSLPHTSILVNLFKEEQPQICLMGATVIGRDLGPRVSSALTSGLTADCTSLEIGDHEDKKEGKVYKNLLYQIRPAFGGNIVATIVNPEHRRFRNQRGSRTHPYLGRMRVRAAQRARCVVTAGPPQSDRGVQKGRAITRPETKRTDVQHFRERKPSGRRGQDGVIDRQGIRVCGTDDELVQGCVRGWLYAGHRIGTAIDVESQRSGCVHVAARAGAVVLKDELLTWRGHR